MVFTEYHIFLCSITDETISLQLSALLYLITIKNKLMNLKRLAKRALATLSLSMLCLVAFAQGRQISGTVIDGTGEPIIGANVLEVGTTNGVITDIDGNFKLSVQPNAKIQVSLSVISHRPLQWVARAISR